MFNVKVDKARSLIAVRLSGLMPAQEVGNYAEELRRQFVLNGLRGYVMLIDISECPIQPQATINALAEHMARMPKASAIAVVTGSSLARMQVRRLFTQPYMRLATTVREGEAWVLEGREPPEHQPQRVA